MTEPFPVVLSRPVAKGLAAYRGLDPEDQARVRRALPLGASAFLHAVPEIERETGTEHPAPLASESLSEWVDWLFAPPGDR